MARKSTGKRLRFEVFKRDLFTCQYCGARPPDVVLVVDHIDPVSLGGETAIDNLITACEACNGGKADIPLGTRQIRPDADLLFLETQQEIAELQRYLRAKAKREAVIKEVIADLQIQWHEYSQAGWAPSDNIVRQLLDKHNPEIVEAAMMDVAGKVRSGYVSEYRWIGYLFKVAANMAEEE